MIVLDKKFAAHIHCNHMKLPFKQVMKFDQLYVYNIIHFYMLYIRALYVRIMNQNAAKVKRAVDLGIAFHRSKTPPLWTAHMWALDFESHLSGGIVSFLLKEEPYFCFLVGRLLTCESLSKHSILNYFSPFYSKKAKKLIINFCK